MATQVISPKSFTATVDLAVFRRVKLTAGSGTAVEYADQSDSISFIGVTQQAVEAGDNVAVKLLQFGETFKCEAADDFLVGATLYAANNGRVSDSSSGTAIGIALQAAGDAGDVVECLLIQGGGTAPGAGALACYDAEIGGVPFVIYAVCVSASGSAETVIASFPRKALLVDAWMIARDTNAANVTVRVSTTAITDAKAKGTTNDAIVPFTKIIGAADEIAAAASVNALFSAQGAADVFLLCVPIE